MLHAHVSLFGPSRIFWFLTSSAAQSIHESVEGPGDVSWWPSLQGTFPALGFLVRTHCDGYYHALQGWVNFNCGFISAVRTQPNLEYREKLLDIQFEIRGYDGEPSLVSGSAAVVFKKFGHPKMFQPQEGVIATIQTAAPQLIPISTYSELANWDGSKSWMYKARQKISVLYR